MKYIIARMIPAITAVLALWVLSTQLSWGQESLPLPKEPHIVVTGVGNVSATPDIIIISLSVEETAPSFAKASQAVNQRVGRLIAVAMDQAVAEKDIQASKINASPQYDWENSKRIYRGEKIQREIKITLRDRKRYQALINGLLSKQLTSLHSTELRFSQLDTLKSTAMKQALDNAKQRAEVIAAWLGTSLKQVFQVAPGNDSPQFYPLQMQAARYADAAKESAGELQIGEQKIEQRVRLVYLLK